MQKQKKQMIVLVILLILLILAYIGVHFYSKKQEEKENAKEEAEKIQVTDLEVSDITVFLCAGWNNTFLYKKWNRVDL